MLGVLLILLFLSFPFCTAKSNSQRPLRSGPFLPSVLAFTRFNCAFPFCPQTSLDVCTADEHYELGRPHVIATLIPMTDTAQMDFSTSTFSMFDNSTRLHYTLAARLLGGQPYNQLFTVFISLNGTSGSLVSSVEVTLPPGVSQGALTYLFTYAGTVYVSTSNGLLLPINPATGSVGNVSSLLPPGVELVGSRAAAFDAVSTVFYQNGVGPSGFFVHGYNVQSGTVLAPVGPLPPTPGTGTGGGGARADTAVATLPVHLPASEGGGFKLLELRTSPEFPWLFLAWLDPNTGNSTQLELPPDWYQDWDIDPDVFVTQWAGSTRRVWDYDPVNNYAWFKLYDVSKENGRERERGKRGKSHTHHTLTHTHPPGVRRQR